jgi:hypothetical protein
MDAETRVAKHYSHGSLEPAILAALTAGGNSSRQTKS